MNELFPNLKEEDAPLDETYFLLSDSKAQKMPHWMVPKSMHNDGNYVVSLGDASQNITWVTLEGGGGPNYPNM
nr:hypothetical protein F987_01075 [Acinetobacter gyllenbergii NIPH 230]